MSKSNFDFDYIVVGSGFGGSVSAMRLSQKGYKVCVIESGKRWSQEDFSKTNWNLHKFLWMPKIFLHGIQRMNLLNDVFILSGSGVGGGSLNYANTLYVPPDKFFENKTVQRLGGKKALLPYFELAKKMLGAVDNPYLGESDHFMRKTAEQMGRGDTFHKTQVGVYFGEEGKKARDPYFAGEGPDRTGCEFCGACMTGCRKNAKNTLDKNYLYFAQKFGARIIPENQVVDVTSLSDDGSAGYEVTSISTTRFVKGCFSKSTIFKTKAIVFSAGVLGTLSLLLKMKNKKHLPNLSDNLGKVVRTNSETLTGVKSNKKEVDYSKGVAITSSVHPDENTHIELVRYAKGNDAMALLTVLLTDGGGKIPRILKYIGNVLTQPFRFFKILNPVGFAHRTLILLVMQTHDNYINVMAKRRCIWPFSKTLTSEQASDKKNPVYIPVANDFTRNLAKKMDGIPCSSFPEVYMNAPVTAHIMGGCSVEKDVIDEQNRVKGYKNMLIVDGSMIPANLGVNPSLSITALSERAMSFIPVKKLKRITFLKAEKLWGVTDLLLKKTDQ